MAISTMSYATHGLLSPLEFIEKLAAIIPPPYRHQVNSYGCLSSHSKLTPLIVHRQEVDAGPAEKKPAQGVPLEVLFGDWWPPWHDSPTPH